VTPLGGVHLVPRLACGLLLGMIMIFSSYFRPLLVCVSPLFFPPLRLPNFIIQNPFVSINFRPFSEGHQVIAVKKREGFVAGVKKECIRTY